MNSNGTIAELKATNYLLKKKYELLDYNFRSRFGEIDIIVKNKKFIVFVEVKARDENSLAEPKEFVDYRKQQRIIKTSGYYLATHPQYLQDYQVRYDVIEVITKNGRIKSLKHLENAFQLV